MLNQTYTKSLPTSAFLKSIVSILDRSTVTMISNLFIKLTIASLVILTACTTTKSVTEAPARPLGAKADREFRAAWVATVANINWPSRPGMPVDSQKLEALQLLDFLKDHNFNAVIFQVRPQADALYKSELEPWSYYLTGEQGKAPDPYYDPLQYWVDAAHERGLELHVWLNPYRAHHVSGGPVSDHSIVKRRPELVYFLKEGYWWFDPAMKGTQDHSAAVVRDLVTRYDLDGVHFDDYFYPYPSYNKNEDFPDSLSWAAYQKSGGKLSRGDWRRQSVNTFIERVYNEIKEIKPHVKFGLSPFGIYRPGYPESVEGFDQYEQLYADARLWFNKGWVDYFAPQLYWPITRLNLSFPVVLGWWTKENSMNRHLWPGISVGRDTSARTVIETMNQIMVSRGMLPESKGVIHWSISSVTKNPAMAKGLIEGPYRRQAIVPSSPWLDSKPPMAPVASNEKAGDSLRISWSHPTEADVFKWVVYYKYGNRWNYTVLTKNEKTFRVPLSRTMNNQVQALTSFAVTAVDRTGNESNWQEIKL